MSIVEAEKTLSTPMEEDLVDKQVDAEEQLLVDQYGMTIAAYREWQTMNVYNFLEGV